VLIGKTPAAEHIVYNIEQEGRASHLAGLSAAPARWLQRCFGLQDAGTKPAS
jgi:hypothetical protein